MSGDTTLTISAIIAIVGFIVLIYNFLQSKKKVTQEEDQKLSTIHESLLKANLKLDSVCATTNETRADIKSMQTQVNALDKRIGIAERDLQTAFIRIDELKEEIKR